MINNPKSTKDAPPEPQARENAAAADTSPYTAFAALVHKGVEELAELQKLSIDMAARHTSDAINTWKQTYKIPSDTPGMFLADLADQGVEKMAEAQKAMIDLVVQQSAQHLDMAKERRDYTAKLTSGAADMLGETAGRAAAAQKIVLEFAAEQNKAVATALKRQAGYAGSAQAAAAVDAIQRNVDAAIQAQKEIVQAVAKPLKSGPASSAA